MNRAPRLSRPIVVEERSDGKFVVATHRGEVWTITEDGIGKKKMLDVGGELAAFGDSGLIGMALHPQFDAPTNPTGWVYLWYVTPHVRGNKAPAFSRLVRYTAKFPMFEEIDESSRLVLVGDTARDGPTIYSSYHGVGALTFGRDGAPADFRTRARESHCVPVNPDSPCRRHTDGGARRRATANDSDSHA